jgi:hypothetical protein
MCEAIDPTSIEQTGEDLVGDFINFDELFGDDFLSDAQEIIDSLPDFSES